MTKISNILISATTSGSGKTTFTLGLLRALKNRGLECQPFKCGPDYIDTKYHNQASGKESVNLDLFLSTENHIKSLYYKYSLSNNVSVTEGVMGLFDGYDKMRGSSGEIAKLLNIPVVLVVNAKSMAYSSAALLYGFKNFYKEIKIAGVVFNFVASESHYNFLKDACKDVGLKALGYIPKNLDIEIPSRHLGLSLDKTYRFDAYADRVAGLIEKYVDIDQLLDICKTNLIDIEYTEVCKYDRKQSIAVARDDAFNFMYVENIEHLKSLGTVNFFSPLKDQVLPEADFVYFPGGYPELYLEELSNNTLMKNSIFDYVQKGGKLLAECGGMMYLSSSITDDKGNVYPMVDIFAQKATMENMKLKLGYRQFSYNGFDFKGHEFHYSSLDSSLTSVCQEYTAKKASVDTKLLRYKNAIAGYTHIYWADMENIIDIFYKK